jgi:tetratricopeptide (TPR) repeat protein
MRIKERNALAQSLEGEPPCEPHHDPARTETRPARIAQAHVGLMAACFLGAATLAVSDETIGIGTPASAHLNRGIDWYAKSERDRAISEYNEAIRLDPALAAAYCCRALAWYDKNDLDKAIADDNEAIRLDPKHIWAYNNRGNAWAAKKEFAKAIADYSEAIRLDPSFTAAYKNRAWIWATCPVERLRDGKQAVASAMRGCELTDWKDPTYLDTLAASYAEAGDFDAAVKTQVKAIGLVKDFEARLKSYQGKKRPPDAPEPVARLSQSRPWAFASQLKSDSFFIVPYDAMLSLTPMGGSAGAPTEFGLGTSQDRHATIFTGLPNNPEPNREVKVGFVAAGSELHFYLKMEWDGVHWAFSHDTKSEAARVAFQDRDNSLGRDGSAIEKTSPTTWLLHLDDVGIPDDDDDDILIQIRLVPAKPPAKP